MASFPDETKRPTGQLWNMGSYPSGQRGLTVNQLANAFGGSNPSPPTAFSNEGTISAALIAQSVEHILGKNGVMGSNPIEGFVALLILSRKEIAYGEAEV